MIFLGDLKIDRNFALESKLEELLLNNVSIVNLESCILDNTNDYLDNSGKGIYSKNNYFLNFDKYFNYYLLANNHIYDYSKKGFLKTLSFVEKKSIGFIKNSIEHNSLIIGEYLLENYVIPDRFAKFCNPKEGPIINKFNSAFFNSKREEIAKSNKKYIISIHGGEELIMSPWPERVKLFRKLIDIGYYAVIGNHSHFDQGYEVYSNRLIVYSLGNFFFKTNKQLVYNGTNKSSVYFFNNEEQIIRYKLIEESNFIYIESTENISLGKDIIRFDRDWSKNCLYKITGYYKKRKDSQLLITSYLKWIRMVLFYSGNKKRDFDILFRINNTY
jgi:hypothetical protein